MGKNDLVNRQDLKDRLDKAVSELKTQCKDAHFIDTCMDRILSLKGQVDTEAVRLVVKESDVVREYKGKTFYIALTKKAAIYHTYGGYTLMADVRNASTLYQTLASLLEAMEGGDKELEETLPYFLQMREEKEGRPLTEAERDEVRKETEATIEADITAKLHVLNCPTWCFGDAEATYGIATAAIQALGETYERLMGVPLQDEDVAATGLFEDAVRGAEHIGEIIREEETNGN